MKAAPLLDRAPSGEVGLEVPESMVYFVYMTVFIDTLAACISTPVMPYYAQSFNVSIEWIGYLYGTWSFCSTVFAPMLSGMSDKWGRKFVLVTCLFGAGLANVIQGSALYIPKIGFWVFLFGRGFSGVWASVGATCQVYISDVAPASIRSGYLEKLAMVPIFAILLGPGLGGAIASAFGYNVPIMTDGIITLFSALVVMYHLVETPAFLQLKAKQQEAASDPSTATKQKAVGVAVHVLGVAGFLGSIASSSNLATYALFFQKRYSLTPLYVGFVFIMMSVSMLLSNMVLVPALKKRLKLKPTQCMFSGLAISGLLTICLGLSQRMEVSLAAMFVGTMGSAISTSQTATVIASFTETSNRGKIFGLLQTYSNTGRIIGPIAATHIAGSVGIGMPFCCSGALAVVAACVYLSVARFAESAPEAKGTGPTASLSRKETKFGESWENETGSQADVESIGQYVAKILTERHYKWMSRRAEVERLLDLALPELKTEHRDAYEESFTLLLNSRACARAVAQV